MKVGKTLQDGRNEGSDRGGLRGGPGTILGSGDLNFGAKNLG